MSSDNNACANDGDAGLGGSLPGDSHKGFNDDERFMNVDYAPDFEHDGARSGCGECFSERPGALGCKGSHPEDGAAATGRRPGAKAFRFREDGQLRFSEPHPRVKGFLTNASA
ncbi:MAG: hypothetical protein U9Q79_00350 [Candidatus Hydrogenedentes bacterium]|nr:hypothetical protein [Candidatus Hydrogenedentota bacterium]